MRLTNKFLKIKAAQCYTELVHIDFLFVENIMQRH